MTSTSRRGLAAAALVVAACAAAVPAHAAQGGSTGMDQTGRGSAVDVCGPTPCADLAAAGTATGKPFAAATFDLAVHVPGGARPASGQCVKAGITLRLHQVGDSFVGEGQGKLCAAADGTATVSSKYSGGGVVGTTTWMWGSGQGTLTATFRPDATVSWRASGTYAVSPLR